ncbi:carboxypeptidase regulatory-like domain-containing protein [Ideonella sp. DXS29W]|uniref:Carboxypeptidase regulatory-like domain-containing protein n=1 Tax=Ideonella lacteola TaxID=2984193 RepID=A0ABU9BXL5_9BURK
MAGCVPYPVYKTLQPASTATVRDEQGRPVADAAVTLVSSAYPYGREKSRETQLTLPDGVAAFAARREWRTEVLALHGWEEYFWNWCVQKEGFATYRTRYGAAADFPTDVNVVLRAGESQPCAAGLSADQPGSPR